MCSTGASSRLPDLQNHILKHLLSLNDWNHYLWFELTCKVQSPDSAPLEAHSRGLLLYRWSKPLIPSSSLGVSIILQLNHPGQPSKFYCTKSAFWFSLVSRLLLTSLQTPHFGYGSLNLAGLSNSGQFSQDHGLLHLTEAISSFLSFENMKHIYSKLWF